ncbi:MAG: amidohydrolase, partial [Actinobacteria bacterium]|nr:amidohydrolase [Actinomycetota bacterium]
MITDGRIQAVLGPGAGAPPARRVLDANGRLLTPGIVDVHGHLDYVLGDSVS